MKYHRSVLEAKLYFGNNLVCSIASEPIQNSEEYINQREEEVKQDCESKAFVRLAEKIKKRFPRLPIIITVDGLYVCQEENANLYTIFSKRNKCTHSMWITSGDLK